ncbi:MAG: hypothetical protein AAGF74_08465 [Pseudomonadota bacterium]
MQRARTIGGLAAGASLLLLVACEQEQGVGFTYIGVPEDSSSADGAFEETTIITENGVERRPLTAEEQALYDTLTPEQKARADAFIADGSTIQSSLQPDL